MTHEQSYSKTRYRQWCGLGFPVGSPEPKKSKTRVFKRESTEEYDAVGRSLPESQISNPDRVQSPAMSAEQQNVLASPPSSPSSVLKAPRGSSASLPRASRSPSPMRDTVVFARDQNVPVSPPPSPNHMGRRTIAYDDPRSPTPPLPKHLRLTEPC